MYIKTTFVLFVIGVAFRVLLIGITNFVNNNIIYNNHQAFATHMETATSNEKTVVHQGIIASGPNPQIKPEPNEGRQSVVILPYRSDGSIYRGVLTYTATKPVEVTLSHRIPIDNTTLSQLNVQKHGKLFVRHLTALPGNISAPSRIIPDYRGATTSPYFAASIPFVASSVVLRTNGEPFIVAYEVSADIVQPKIIKHLENATLTSATTNNGNKDNGSHIAK
ncbi:MAG: hypothetical protein WCF06_05940 [Nitrososphaeraceae archaeon]